MKQIIFAVALALCIVSCNSNKKTESTEDANNTELNAGILALELDSLLTDADQLLDQTVKVRGYVTHTCKHSGKRCFIVGDSQKASMRVEAKGEIGGFNKELVGSKLEITGTVKERRLSQEYIAQMEKEVNEKSLKEDGSAETCQAELNNISEMKAWMKEQNKDYYSIYYMDGQSYEVLN